MTWEGQTLILGQRVLVKRTAALTESVHGELNANADEEISL